MPRFLGKTLPKNRGVNLLQCHNKVQKMMKKAHIEKEFWLHKTLLEMNDAEWEALCDGCGKCCYRKYLDEDDNLYYTRIACNQLDLRTGKCQHYRQRFKRETDCTKLTKENLADFSWLPESCAYRLRYENRPLFDWHPLISGNPESVKLAHIGIKNGIHERDVIDWIDFIID